MRILSKLQSVIEEQRGFLFPWVPVCLAVGIGTYFKLPHEPGLIFVFTLLCVSALVVGVLVRLPNTGAVPVLGISIVIFGIGLGALRSMIVEGPILSFRYYGPIEGRVIGIDRSMSDKVRLTLDRVYLNKVGPQKTPARVRVAVHTKGFRAPPAIGSTVILTGHLSRPQGPAEPGGFDFQRYAWFKKLGAVGYTRTPVLLAARPSDLDPRVRVTDLRHRISMSVKNALGGEIGGFAAAILTGDRSGIGQDTMDNLRASNLAHLLAISGLHMGLLTGFVFGAIRVGFACVPFAAHRLATKKIAALGALLAGASYLVLSGGAVATERAFIMAAMMLTAVLMDRRALTLRAVSLAAIIVLTIRPESLISPGFQMSFAATTALVVAFRGVKTLNIRRLPKPVLSVFGLVLSSAVAGLATAPFGAAHFNQIAHFGLLANILSVPLMGAVIIPAAVLSALLWVIGLEWIGLKIMGAGIDWILGVAAWVSGLDGSISHISTPHWTTLPLIALGGLFMILWQGRVRSLGIVVFVAGFVTWSQTERPIVLISQSGGLVGTLTEQGRALSKPRGDGFTARSWLENDGENIDQKTASARKGFETMDGIRMAKVSSVKIAHLTGKTGLALLSSACDQADIVVTNFDAQMSGCVIFDPSRLRKTGAIAIDGFEPLKMRTTAQLAGKRPWNRR